MPNVFDPVHRRASDSPDDVALRAESLSISYAELSDLSLAFGATLRREGLAPGDRVVLLAPSVPAFVIGYFGIQSIGAIAVTVNTMSTVNECEYYLQDSGAVLALGWHESSTALREAADSLGVAFRALGPSAQSVDPVMRGTAAVPDIADRRPDDTAAILYTSGTTGRPKGAELTVSNILASGEIAAHLRNATADDRTGSALPLFHVYGQAAVMMGTLSSGGSLSLLERFTATDMTEIIRRDALTVVLGVPTMWNAMLGSSSAGLDKVTTTLRLAISGGAALPTEVADSLQELLGCPVIEGYGLTETTAMTTFMTPDRITRGSVGHPAPRTRVELRDRDGNVCPEGVVGEIYIAGDTVMKGYWNRPDATEEVLIDGWLRTGDLGRFDSEGYLHIVDRLKDIIIRGGYNVYPSEVEEVLYALPGVVEAAVVGVPHAHYGEEVMAVVVVRNDIGLDADDVTRWSRQHLSPYKVPRIVRLTAELPKGSTGKISKKDIPRTIVESDVRVASSAPS